MKSKDGHEITSFRTNKGKNLEIKIECRLNGNLVKSYWTSFNPNGIEDKGVWSSGGRFDVKFSKDEVQAALNNI